MGCSNFQWSGCQQIGHGLIGIQRLGQHLDQWPFWKHLRQAPGRVDFDWAPVGWGLWTSLVPFAGVLMTSGQLSRHELGA